MRHPRSLRQCTQTSQISKMNSAIAFPQNQELIPKQYAESVEQENG